MLDRGAYYECSNILCDYEEDILNQGAVLGEGAELPGLILFRSTTLTSATSSEIYLVKQN